MKNNPILVVSGEPYSVFTEIFLKAFKKKKYKKKLILIISKKLFLSQMKLLGFNFDINLVDKYNINFDKLSRNKINIIDIKYDFKKAFDKISNKSNRYIRESFKVALDLMKKKNYSGLINGPISKKNFLKGDFFGITEYLANQTNRIDKVSMLIYHIKNYL